MQLPSSETVNTALAATGSKATYTGASMSVFSWLLTSEAGVLAGIVIGVLGLVLNFVFKRREDARLQEEHQARMQEIADRRAIDAIRARAE